MGKSRIGVEERWICGCSKKKKRAKNLSTHYQITNRGKRKHKISHAASLSLFLPLWLIDSFSFSPFFLFSSQGKDQTNPRTPQSQPASLQPERIPAPPFVRGQLHHSWNLHPYDYHHHSSSSSSLPPSLPPPSTPPRSSSLSFFISFLADLPGTSVFQFPTQSFGLCARVLPVAIPIVPSRGSLCLLA
ncbi:hypothetical protein BO70DRAFT_131092 [Aspergillus heteromorphus CBS 117.55]|uniref:Uncharacterized protein n=1 Tax=Aspergillus heteromorphus CBS 117.55 TaxID=1448321 RepID=A0A317WUC4_9EURO|nr:uncharacterized protein BO70DRAFT_131092 [Aspergillus heteromorphus CBS 117.55]PWY89939.1 hypothetical protein BO70DRAFT_131092 [Aspergillus heteromorphus CBS 117.55]